MSNAFSDLPTFVWIQHLDHVHIMKKRYFLRNLKKGRRIICEKCLGEISLERTRPLLDRRRK